MPEPKEPSLGEMLDKIEHIEYSMHGDCVNTEVLRSTLAARVMALCECEAGGCTCTELKALAAEIRGKI